MTIEEEKKIADWLNGDLYLRNGLSGGIDSKDTTYDQAMSTPSDWADRENPYLAESPADPYEYYTTKKILDGTTDCSTSIGGVDGYNFDPKGVWRRNCKMFYKI